MRPDLASPEGRRAYAAELGGVARGWRWLGLGLVTLGAAGLVVRAVADAPLWDGLLGPGSVALVLVGWALAIVGIVKRTRYHRRRMAD
ncbi:MAG: hypothetical protein QOJ53_1144 [Sphingomonadales bacterium]|jgi:hypothetical protein|nr:hypothetical protein [Sphingomonadales bacterium]MEA3045148.1 hypothetical protein [Sphingomonadales bacterium]MEA3046812.1 hypothetical protein [Sphingomonadales bacterium]